ncbi:unnamed protein product [Dovyalis caffra]|uniref:Uncharacterized protein n=1 Tax=Dovyalis caffra TaxID=77055 RepID=A0AAV1SSM5_9ROSI|nr:unnamed protein product [Dovyalis caffra]
MGTMLRPCHFTWGCKRDTLESGETENGSSSWKMLPGHWPSWEIREGSERAGFEVVTLDGREALLSSTTISTLAVSILVFAATFCIVRLGSPESIRWPTVGKYKVDIASFEALALPELQVREDTDLFIIDEVGKMELFSSSFFPAVLNVLESNIPLLASIPIPKFGRDIPAVARLRNHPGAKIFTLSPSNRDAVKEQVYTQLVGSFAK